MTRFWYGGTLADWTFDSRDGVDGIDDLVQSLGGVEITFWTQEVGGERYLDLVNGSNTAVSSIFSSDGSDGRSVGTIPPFEGPDNVASMWASASGGPRLLIKGQTEQALLDVIAQAAQVDADLRSHIAAPNPHVMASHDLADYSDDTPEDGQVAVYRAAEGKYVPTTVQGLDPDAFVSTRGGSEIVVPAGTTSVRGFGLRLPPGDRSAAANGVEVWWNAGTEAAPNWVLVTRLSPYGEFRGRPAKGDRVAGQVSQAPGQTANLWEFTDLSGNLLSAVDAAGRFRAPNVAITPSWSQETGTAGSGTYRYYNPTGGPLILRGFIVSCGGTAPAGGDYVINPKLDGNAVFSSANRPKIAAGQRTSGLVTSLSTTVWPAGGYLTVDVDAVPTTAPTKVTIQAVAY